MWLQRHRHADAAAQVALPISLAAAQGSAPRLDEQRMHHAQVRNATQPDDLAGFGLPLFKGPQRLDLPSLGLVFREPRTPSRQPQTRKSRA